MRGWLPNFHAQGRTDFSLATITRRRDDYVEQAPPQAQLSLPSVLQRLLRVGRYVRRRVEERRREVSGATLSIRRR